MRSRELREASSEVLVGVVMAVAAKAAKMTRFIGQIPQTMASG